MIIRAMTAADHPEIVRINEQGRPGVAPLDDAEVARLAALSDHHLVATSDSTVVAYLLALHRDAPYDGEEFHVLRARIDHPFLYVDQIAVAQAKRGAGLGRDLYGAIESTAILAGIGSLCCEVNTNPPNPASSAFHRKLGFRVMAHLSTADGRDVELLVKRL